MSDPTLKFLVFAAFSAICLLAGYGLRRRGVMKEDWSRPIHLHTVIWIWSPITLQAFWRLDLNAEFYVLLALQPGLLLLGWALAAWAGRLMRLPRESVGVLILCAALSNQGFTLGAYLCYSIFTDGQMAMGYAIAIVTVMQVLIVLIFYPVARHYGPEDAVKLSKLIVGSFLDIRAAPLWAAVLGVGLNVSGMEFPTGIDETPILDVGFFVGAIGSYLGIGLRLRIGDAARYVGQHATLVAIKFLVMPAIVWAMLWGLHVTPVTLNPLMEKVMLISWSCPCAIAVVIIANLFHLNPRQASVMFLVNTALWLVLVLPVVLWLT